MSGSDDRRMQIRIDGVVWVFRLDRQGPSD